MREQTVCHLCLAITREDDLVVVTCTRGENPERYLCETCLIDVQAAINELG